MPGPAILLDNPMLVKHLRSRLRPAQMFPWLVVIVVLCACIVWAGQTFGMYASGTALVFVVGLEALILVLIGAGQVGSSIGGARESGILDFHRVSPQPPSWLAAGFFLGAPIREYVMFAVTIPFALTIAFLSPAGFGGLLAMWVVMIFGAWIVHAISLLGGLMSKHPKAGGRGGFVGLIIFGIFLARPIGSGIFIASTRFQESAATISLFGLPVHWLAFVVFYQSVALGFLLLACSRKMRSESAHIYTKPEAVACMATLATLLLGAFWGYPNAEFLVLVMLYALTLAACILAATVTPTQAEYVRGLRRAFHQGRRRPSLWSDEGTNQVVVYLLCGIVFFSSTILWEVLVGRNAGGTTAHSQTIAIGVFVAAYCGLGLQYFLLRLPKSGGSIMGLFIFIVWLIPLLIGAIAMGSALEQSLAQLIAALSPLAGIALSSGLIPNIADAVRFMALAPALTLAFLFGFMLVNIQRRLDRAVKTSAGLMKKPVGPFDYLDSKPRYDELGVVEDGEARPNAVPL